MGFLSNTQSEIHDLRSQTTNKAARRIFPQFSNDPRVSQTLPKRMGARKKP